MNDQERIASLETQVNELQQRLNNNYETAKEYLIQGNGHLEDKDYSAAIAKYTQAIEHYPDLGVAYSNRAVAYSRIDKHELSIRDLEIAIKLIPDNGWAYLNRGIAILWEQVNKAHELAIETHDTKLVKVIDEINKNGLKREEYLIK